MLGAQPFTRIGAAAIAVLARLDHLQIVWLTGTQISDASVPVLEQLAALRSVDLQRTGVSAPAVARLRGSDATLEVNPLILVPAP